MHKKRLYTLTFSVLILLGATGQMWAQNLQDRVQFYFGSGADTTFLVVDFKDTTFDASSVWGYRYDAPQTGLDLVSTWDSLDLNVQVNFDTASFGIFLQDIVYHRHAGLGGMPNFWATWDGSELDSLSTNMGLADTLIPGGVWGLTYTDFSPALAPDSAIAAFDPAAYGLNDVKRSFGTGNDTALLVLDFRNGSDTVSYGWGYAFDDSVSTAQMLADLDTAVNGLNLTYNNGSLTSASFDGLSASNGAGAGWLSWRGSNPGNWRPSSSSWVYSGTFAGYRFQDTATHLRPRLPFHFGKSIGIPSSPRLSQSGLFPVPATAKLYSEKPLQELRLYNVQGQEVYRTQSLPASIEHLPQGTYLARTLDREGNEGQQKIMLR